jgi:hypothetical protein
MRHLAAAGRWDPVTVIGLPWTNYRRELLGGGEGGANTCKTSSYCTETVVLIVSAGAEIAAGAGNTYTPLLTRDAPCWWQQDMLHAANPALRECSHSISFFVASLFSVEFVFPCPCAAHMFPAQHPIPRAIHADAHIGVHSSNTAIRHTQAPTVLPGAIGAWSEPFITRDSRIPELPVIFQIPLRSAHPCTSLPANRISP